MKRRTKRVTLLASGAVALCAAVAALITAPTAQAVVGGHEVDRPQSWAVKIIDDGDLNCSGVLVDQRWVMTVAHCVNEQPWDQLSVRVGGVWRGQGTVRAVKSVNILPGFGGDGSGVNDLALLGLYNPVDEAPIALGGTVRDGDDVRLYGYGRIEDDEPSRLLKWASLRVFDVGRQGFASHGELGRDGAPASGDSGAPVIDSQGRLVGVHDQTDSNCTTPDYAQTGSYSSPKWASDGIQGECVEGKTSHYATQVAAHRAWIRSVAGV